MPAASLPFNPSNFPCVRIVDSFEKLVTTRFTGAVNALCWPRELAGDYAEIEQCLPAVDDITSIDEEDLRGLKLSPAGALARDQLIRDQRLLTSHSLDPSLDIVPATEPDLQAAPIRTDVGDWHVDSATVEADTYLCSYLGLSTEGIRNEDATCQVDVPSTRETLRQIYGGADDAAFRAHLSKRFYDLHYANSSHARIYSFGSGHLWRIATQYPGSPVPPCIHRAPASSADRSRRLLLIS
jgi:hypothetical protein